MRGKRRKPVHSKIMYPDNQHGKIDGQDPEHEDQHRVHEIVKIKVRPRTLREVSESRVRCMGKQAYRLSRKA